MEAQRAKREQDRICRLEDEEIERRRVDAIEQDYQDDLRRQTIENANTHMQQSQDMVKALKSKMLMCDVAYEQQAQKTLADRKKNMHKEIEKHWEEVEKQKMTEYDEKMKKKLEQEYHLRQENSKNISDQLEQFKLNYIKSIKEELLEGELIKRQVEEDLEREKQKEIARQKKGAQIRADLAEANKNQLKQKQATLLEEAETEKKIDEFAKARDARDEMKKEREDERFKAKQNERQRMIDR